ncbi:MAG: DUF4148 domain-containing protein [Noviherbaspirillum sp.]
MKTRQLIAAAAMLAAAATAFAQETETVDPAAGFVSTKTRAQVMEELRQAQADGTYVIVGGEEYAGQAEMLARARQGAPEATRMAMEQQRRAEKSGS